MNVWRAGEGIVEFPDGRRVRARGLRASSSSGLEPQFGLYLLGRDPCIDESRYRWVCWPDFRLPASTSDALNALREAYERATSERVEIACDGGIGRTGTALSVLAIMSGVPVDEAVAWVREHHHSHAVETPRQKRWVSEVAVSLRT
ncbi:protein-tyrosine phosphatase family protein [Brevibacterium sp. FAM 27836]|uniref:protein-tyrosine phosphatase family protein n=1 Tax=Brevibacterium sp. FAM 27836 TaxID=3446693 RepID=UPI003F514DCE